MDEQLKEILEEFWAWRLEEAPEFGTMVGEHSRDDLLDDMSLAAYDKRMVSGSVIYLQGFVSLVCLVCACCSLKRF